MGFLDRFRGKSEDVVEERDAYANSNDDKSRNSASTSPDSASRADVEKGDVDANKVDVEARDAALRDADAVNPSQLESGLRRVDSQDTANEIRPVSYVPGNQHYYEKGGLRTYGDGQDHLTEEPMTFMRFMIFVAMGFLWCGSQIVLYLVGGIISQITGELGGGDRYVWIALGNLIPLACITPFVGGLTDLFGRKNVALLSALLGMIGGIVCATTHNMNVFIGGQVLAGISAGIGELISLAVAGESAPTKKRGLYVGAIIITILPYCPSVLYAELITYASTWRWVCAWTAIWNFLALVLVYFFYWPPKRPNAQGLSKWEIFNRMDWIGGLLSTGGLTLFLAGLVWAGYQYPWDSAHVIASLTIGIVLIIAFIVWEAFFVKYPLFPARLKRHPRAFYTICFITFVSGANFFAVLVFWPTQYYSMYTGPNPVPTAVSAGVGSLPVGFGIIGGSIIFSQLVSLLKGRVRLLMIASCIIMTAGNGAMAGARLDNLPGVYVAVTLACLGVGAVIVPSQVITSIVCPDDLIGTVVALTISLRTVGGTIGYAAYYHLVHQNFTAAIEKYMVPTLIKIGIHDKENIIAISDAVSNGLRATIPNFPGVDTPEKAIAIIEAGNLCFQDAYPKVYFVSIAFGGAAIIAACLLPDITKLMDNHVAVQYNHH